MKNQATAKPTAAKAASNREQQEPDFWASPCDRTTATSGLALGRGAANKKLVPAVEVGFVRANVHSKHVISLATARSLRDQLAAILND